jgi:hypothetical protein
MANPSNPERVESLPDVVTRYLSFALGGNRQWIRRARFKQVGEMRSSSRSRWHPFSAVETITTEPVSFRWNATMQLAPFLSVHVHDEYVPGNGGTSEANIAGIFPLGRQRGTPEVTSASLLRYLAEAPWYPTALLPSEHLRWSHVDAMTARATLTDRGTTVWADFTFGSNGDVRRIAAMRYRDVSGIPVLTPWTGDFTNYARLGELMIPLEGAVDWVPATGPFCVWRGRIIDAQYQRESA